MVTRMKWAAAAVSLLSMSAVAVAAGLPDPTALPRAMSAPAAEAPTVEPVLEWIKSNGRQSLAWYGGSTVKVGDTTEAGRVTAIHEDHIVISGKNGRRSVYLLEQSIRTQPLERPRRGR